MCVGGGVVNVLVTLAFRLRKISGICGSRKAVSLIVCKHQQQKEGRTRNGGSWRDAASQRSAQRAFRVTNCWTAW